ncbi:glycosyltransferase family 4 protein [Plectonema radiosum NIES-515]|uniref:Glycosyltransferase family 4 protein n=1 Tax=Plectonema radiosum NIES-515 TaxID=2986073 RepID=A0ABT3B1J5_9CYAN|nr:glycosyltransferase family 4 protein [Plectonema radiosum]MCV3215243.1 glycosyltransferase family 4 protein [Plectonema radiosum NIES-515]
MHKSLKIQIISRTPPYSHFGGTAYLLDFIRYLHKKGFQIEYTIISSTPGGKTPWYVIPSSFREFVNMSASGNFPIKFILLRFRPFLDWIFVPPRLLYNYLLPNFVKSIYRAIKKRQQQEKLHTIATINNNQIEAVDTLPTPEELAFVKSEFNRVKPDVVIANYAWLGSVLDVLPAKTSVVKVILTHDVLHQRVAHFKQVGTASRHSNWDWENEAIQLRKAHILLAIQSEEAKTFKEMAPLSDVICMPMSATCKTYPSSQVRGRCLFVGSDSPHNVHGLQWFLEKVWHLVLELNPHSNLHVCGAVGEKIQGTFPNVKFLGKVDDLSAEYGVAEVCLVPLLAGSGLKIKLVEALSYSRACVATTIGAQGLQEIVDKAILLADTPNDFAAAIHQILTNPDKRRFMEEQAQAYVINRLSPESVYQPFVERIHQHLYQQATELQITEIAKVS